MSDKLKKPIGRPLASPEHKRVTLAVRIHPRTKKTLKELAKAQCLSVGELIDRLSGEVTK